MPVKVLIVDDMKGFLDLETSFLNRTDCTVFKAANGLEALRIAKSERPDIVFLDLEMPVMNGLECCRFIKSDVDLKDVPVVIVTASSKEEECFRAGCNAYLRKPVDEDIFLTEIKKFVQIKERSDPRVDTDIPVNVSFKGTKTQGAARNISRSGLMLETNEPFGVGSVITIDFVLPDSKDKVKTKAIIVRHAKIMSTGSDGFGIRFFEISEKQQMLVNSFIDARLK